MTYSTFQYVKNLKKELEKWEEKKKEAETADVLTKSGYAKYAKIPKIEKRIQEIEQHRNQLINELTEWSKSVGMSNEELDMVRQYYFENKTKYDIADNFCTTSFYYKIKSYCYDLK